jgi:CHAT domain-containing protein/tetratricopeptide (TPR) repeat protein
MFIQRSRTLKVGTSRFGFLYWPLVIWIVGSFCLPDIFQSQAAKSNKPAAPVAVPPSVPPPVVEPGRNLLKKGLRSLEQGRTGESIQVLRQASEKCQVEKDLQCEAEAHRGLGDAYARQGALFVPNAAEQYNQAVDLFRKKASSMPLNKPIPIAEMKFNAQMTLAKLGDLYYKQKNYEESEKYYNQIAPEKPKLDATETNKEIQKGKDVKNKPTQTKNRTESLGRNLGGIFTRKPSLNTAGDIGSTADSAVYTAKDVEKTVKGVVEDVHQANLSLKSYCLSDISLGRVALARGLEPVAQERFDSALKFATRYPPFFGKNPTSQRFQIIILTDQGDLALKQQKPADAANKYQAARERARAAQRPDLSWPASRGMGRAQWALAQSEYQKDPRSTRYLTYRDASLAAYRDSLTTIEELRSNSIRGDEARQSFSAQTADVYQEYLQMLASLALLAAGGDNSRPLIGEALQYASEAFRVAEGARSRALLDLMSESGVEIQTGMDSTLLEKRRRLADQQTGLADQLIGLGGEGRDTNVNQDDQSIEREIDQLETQLAELDAQIRSSNPRFANLTTPSPIAIPAVQEKLLDDQSALLSYWMDEFHSLLWVVGKKGVWLHNLGPSSNINERVAQLRDLLRASAEAATPDPVVTTPAASSRGAKSPATSTTKSPAKTAAKTTTPPPKGTTRKPTRDLKMVKTPEPPPLRDLEESPAARKFAESAFSLYFTLVRPVSDAISGKRLIIVPDGSLFSLPFEALVTVLPQPGGDPPADFAALSYLIHQNVISYAPSATVLATMKAEPTEMKPAAAALLVGDPVFDPADSRVKKGAALPSSSNSQRDLVMKEFSDETTPAAQPPDSTGTATTTAGETTAKIPRLPATRTEVTEIANLLRQNNVQPALFLDLDANESLFRGKDLQNYQYIHLATHGLLNADHPESSGLLLSLVGNSPDMDGFLRTREIFNLRLGAPIVMLSACKTGLGQLRKGEGLIGLTRAFIFAGARDVGVSLWPVDDNSTAQLMRNFYGSLLIKKETSSSPQSSSNEPAFALRTAQIQMINGRKYSPPFFWAPFILVGQ